MIFSVPCAGGTRQTVPMGGIPHLYTCLKSLLMDLSRGKQSWAEPWPPTEVERGKESRAKYQDFVSSS